MKTEKWHSKINKMTAKEFLGGKFMTIPACVKKQEKSQRNNLTSPLQELEKEQMKPKVSRRRGNNDDQSGEQWNREWKYSRNDQRNQELVLEKEKQNGPKPLSQSRWEQERGLPWSLELGHRGSSGKGSPERPERVERALQLRECEDTSAWQPVGAQHLLLMVERWHEWMSKGKKSRRGEGDGV